MAAPVPRQESTTLTDACSWRPTTESVCPAFTCGVARRRRFFSCSGVPGGLMPHTMSPGTDKPSVLCATINMTSTSTLLVLREIVK